MTMGKRVPKQIVIGIIFLLLISGVTFGFIDYFFLVEPTCFDGVKNGQEEGVDCGLLACGVACEPAILSLNIISQKLSPIYLIKQAQIFFQAIFQIHPIILL